uniref:uncharacterized protein LOC122587620 n=1 Tax=Erigeron canadensis TaxID=72917 RepID=UPI001CB99085|nr:uncharacterized protein LOC122587620 [Erigeron canadensis]
MNRFEWPDDSSLEVFVNAIESEEAESSTARSRAKRKVMNHNRRTASQRLHRDYFCGEPKYDDDFFEDRYRMSKRLFLKIMHDLKSRYAYFQDSYDAWLAKSFTPIQKCTSTIRQLATGNPPNEHDEYLEMAGRTSRDCIQFFSDIIVDTYSTEYLSNPTTHDIHRLFEAHEERHHLPGMIGSLDFTHLVRKMCPMEWRGQYKRGDHQYPTIMLEATASQDLWICVNGRTYKCGYYLVDGIYLTWSTFVKAYKYPTDSKEKMFKTAQEAARKDIELEFGVLKGKWHILDRPFRQQSLETMRNLVYACVILHNMVIQDSGCAICPVHIGDPVLQPSSHQDPLPEIQNEEIHFCLRYDLTEHLAGLNLPHLQPNDE